jgi:drug/metabolite transporter (DMT)-like permease
MWVCGSASVGLAVFMLVSRNTQVPSELSHWAAIAGMGVATTIAFACTFAGLRRVGAVRTAIVSSTEPLAAAVLAFVFLQEPIGAGTIIGGALILAGAITAAIVRPVSPAEPPIP